MGGPLPGREVAGSHPAGQGRLQRGAAEPGAFDSMAQRGPEGGPAPAAASWLPPQPPNTGGTLGLKEVVAPDPQL